MNRMAFAILGILLLGMISPALAGDIGRYSYITVENIEINLVNERASVDVYYTIDDGIQLLVMLLGKSDLKNKLTKIVNYDGEFQLVELDHAVLIVEGASEDYGDGSYWFPEHTFGIIVPELTVQTPQVTRTYYLTDEFSSGIGHFRVP